MRTKTTLLFASTLAFFVAACGGSNTPQTDCTDGQDNDGDGFIDDADPGCPFNGGQLETPDPAACNDGVDNDGDTLIDLEDFGCETSTDVEEEDPVRACNDTVDNDGDGWVDYPDDTGCTTPVDDDEFNTPHCSDTIDNDVDGKTDFPFDPGCASTDDPDEADDCPAGPSCPQCANEMDDDADGDIDAADQGCDFAADPDEFNVEFGECGPSVSITDISLSGEGTGTIDGPLPNQLSSSVCNGFGGEFAFTYTVLSGPVALLVSTDHPETTLDTVVYVRTICQQPMSELGCDDDSGTTSPNSSTLIIPSVEAGSYFIIVDAYGPGSLGDFRVTVEERTALHGACDPSDPEPCVPGLICRSYMPGDPTTCEYHVCGDSLDNDADGITDYPNEPGCLDILDDTEDDTCPGAGCPECADGIDNDSDGVIDFGGADPGCDAASDNLELDECYPGKTVEYLDPVTGVTDTTAGATGVTGGSCGGSDAPELVYALTVNIPLDSLTIDTDNAITDAGFDTILYVREGMCDSASAQVACNDNISPFNIHSSVTFTPTLGETYFVFVDSLWGGAGNFHLDVSGVILPDGPCDPAIPSFSCTSGYACQEMTPGSGFLCLVADCADGTDNDTDGFIDFPLDPGCATASDDAEDFPNPITECSNGIDDDADGIVDFSTGPTGDPGCTSAADDNELDECYPGVPVEILDPVAGTTGTTTSGSNSTGGSCGGSDSNELIYALRVNSDLVSLTFDTDNATTGTFDTVLYVRAGMCDTGTEVACNDDISGFDQNSSVTITPTTGETYFVFADSKWGAVGTFHIDVSGIIAAGEVCDPAIPTFACVAGNACRESTPGAGDWLCRTAYCNDGLDNDTDTFTDYPFDPGCASTSDDDEGFPNPITECSDGINNDGDTLTDFPADLGCTSAADNSEIDDCVPGAPVIDHPGGTLSGDTTGAPSLLSAPSSCDTSASTGTTPERVYVFNNTRAGIANLHFTTAGSAIDTVLYLRYNVCGTAGPASYCLDDDGGGEFTSTVDIPAPATGYWFAIVDGKWSGVGAFDLTIYGELATGATCTPGDVKYVCSYGNSCSAITNTCVASACNDGVDNDGDGDIDAGDPGCVDIADNDESDTCPGGSCPECGNGSDDDGDGLTDYPSDPGCDRASDDVEMDCAHDMCVEGGVLASSCDPCVASICAVDSFCCFTAWDSICVSEVSSVCGLSCP